MIRLGTRRSALAMAQAQLVADGLASAEIVPITTAGDRDRSSSFDAIGDGRGVFTREIERGTMESLLSMPIKPIEIMGRDVIPEVTEFPASPST